MNNDVLNNDELFDEVMDLLRTVACRNKNTPSDIESICEDCFNEACENLEIDSEWEELSDESKSLLIESFEDCFYR